jgi:hypothetical protein
MPTINPRKLKQEWDRYRKALEKIAEAEGIHYARNLAKNALADKEMRKP